MGKNESKKFFILTKNDAFKKYSEAFKVNYKPKKVIKNNIKKRTDPHNKKPTQNKSYERK